MINKCAIKITPVGRDRRFARPGWFALMQNTNWEQN